MCSPVLQRLWCVHRKCAVYERSLPRSHDSQSACACRFQVLAYNYMADVLGIASEEAYPYRGISDYCHEDIPHAAKFSNVRVQLVIFHLGNLFPAQQWQLHVPLLTVARCLVEYTGAALCSELQGVGAHVVPPFMQRCQMCGMRCCTGCAVCPFCIFPRSSRVCTCWTLRAAS